jgi:N-acylneuraminate cytidylyltransferase
MKNFRILALIPARGGSKRLPGKNIKVLGSKPLIAWSIDIVKGNPYICDILVSTDCPDIADVAKEFGAYVPWLRPEIYSTDTSSSVDMTIHALNWYEENHGLVDGVLLLQPTSPFRNQKILQLGIELFKEKKNPVIAVSKTHIHPSWTFKIVEGKLIPFMDQNGMEKRSQDLDSAFIVNGSFYLTSPIYLKNTLSFYKPIAIPLIIENEIESIDIDTILDFEFAEYLATKYKLQ